MAGKCVKLNLKKQTYRNDRFKEYWMKYASRIFCDRNSLKRLFKDDGFFLTSSSEEILDFIMNDSDYRNEKIIFYYVRDFVSSNICKTFDFVGRHKQICADRMVLIGKTSDSHISVLIGDYVKHRAFGVWR